MRHPAVLACRTVSSRYRGLRTPKANPDTDFQIGIAWLSSASITGSASGASSVIAIVSPVTRIRRAQARRNFEGSLRIRSVSPCQVEGSASCLIEKLFGIGVISLVDLWCARERFRESWLPRAAFLLARPVLLRTLIRVVPTLNSKPREWVRTALREASC